MTAQGWKYCDHVPEARQVALASAGSFVALAKQVVADASNIRVRAEPGRGKGLTDCVQPLFNIDLPQTGDALFNGPFGYRAQYWLGPEQGLAANARLLAALAPKLLGALETCTDELLSRIDVCVALGAATGFEASVVAGRFMIHARRGQSPCVVIVEPDAEARLLVVVTVYEVSQ